MASDAPDIPVGLARLNGAPAREAWHRLHTVCGSRRWADAMTGARPFASRDALLARADAEWAALDEADWREAFGHHPRIGERDLAQARFAATAAQSSREQSGMAAATESVRRAFADGNAEYERRFGHVFLVCATGKSADEMLANLRARLANDAPTELRNAAEQQRLITRIRLERLVHS